MPRSLLLRLAALVLATGPLLTAQEAVSYTFKLAGGPATGGLKNPLGNAGFTFGADLEAAFRLGSGAQLVAGLGWRAFPGDFTVVSSIPFTYAATGVNPTIYESRVRKPEAQGWQLTGLYRSPLPVWTGAYWQAGLRIGSNRLTETDTGTQLVTDGRASTVSGNVLAVNTIAVQRTSTTLSAGAMAGAGYALGDFTLELNLWTASVESAVLGKHSGLVSELAFGFRF